MKSIIITGATGGLGYSLVQSVCSQLQGQEYEVLCTYRNKDKYQALYSEFDKKIKGTCVSNSKFYDVIVKEINIATSEVIVFLNAFSIIPLKRIGEYTVEDVESMIDCNIKQNVFLLNALVHYCKQNKMGFKVVNIDSGAADYPLKTWGNYCASKSYINSFLGVVALENPDYKIVSVDPGVMDTDMQKEIRQLPQSEFDQVEKFRQYHEKGLLRNVDEVAKYLVERYLIGWKTKSLREKID